MRVSERQIFDSGGARLGALRARFAEKAAQASSGQRVPTAATDPSTAALLARNEASRVRAESIARTTRSANDDLSAVDGALNEAGSVLEQALALAVQMANDSFSGADRQAAAVAADAHLGAFVSALNVEQDGRFLLGGTRQDAPPFQSDGSYVGDDGVRSVEAAPGVFEDVSVRADLGIKGGAGGVDIPGALAGLRDALAANDRDAVRASIDTLRGGVVQLSALRSDVGSKGTLLLNAENTATSVRLATDQSSASAGDVDIAAAATELALAERSFEAATAATAKSFQLTIIDRLR